MKNSLEKDLGLKILSLLIAILLWVIIVNVDDPTKSRTFSNIPVNLINEDAIALVNQVYTITEGETVEVTVTGKRSVVENLRSSDLVATADLSALSIVNATDIVVTCPKYTEDNLTITLGKVKMLKVSLEDLSSNKFSVEIKQTGEVGEGYYINEKTASPNMITVTGPESVIAKIAKVSVSIDVTGRTSSFATTVTPKVYDANDQLIDPTGLKFSEDEVTVNVNLVKTKEVVLYITHTGKPKEGYELSELDYEPRKIHVAGTQEALAQVSYIPYELDISNLYRNYEVTQDLSEVIMDKGLIPVEGENVVAISVKFHKLATEQIDVGKKDIRLRNLRTGYKVEVNTDSVNVVVRGSSKEVMNLKAADLEPYIDLSGKGEGDFILNLKFASNDSYEIMNQPTIGVTVTKKDE